MTISRIAAGGRTPPELRRARLATATLFFATAAGSAAGCRTSRTSRSGTACPTACSGSPCWRLPAARSPHRRSGRALPRYGGQPTSRAAAHSRRAALAAARVEFLCCAAFVLLGIGIGALDVSMNAHAVLVEERYGRPIMSSFHGLFSLGGLVGAALAGKGDAGGAAARPHLVIAAVMLGASCSRRGLAAAHGARAGRRPVRRAARTARGAGRGRTDRVHGRGAMGDVVGDRRRHGPRRVARHRRLGLCRLLADHGDRAVFRATAWWRASARPRSWSPVRDRRCHARRGAARRPSGRGRGGFAGMGFGLANVAPIVFSAAGRLPELAPGIGIAAVSTAGYGGFLARAAADRPGRRAERPPVGLGLVALAVGFMVLGTSAHGAGRRRDGTGGVTSIATRDRLIGTARRRAPTRPAGSRWPRRGVPVALRPGTAAGADRVVEVHRQEAAAIRLLVETSPFLTWASRQQALNP